MSWSACQRIWGLVGVCVLERCSGTGSFRQLFCYCCGPAPTQSQTLHHIHGPVLAGVPNKRPRRVLIAGVRRVATWRHWMEGRTCWPGFISGFSCLPPLPSLSLGILLKGYSLYYNRKTCGSCVQKPVWITVEESHGLLSRFRFHLDDVEPLVGRGGHALLKDSVEIL